MKEYRCKRCGEIVQYCDSEEHAERANSSEVPLKKKFYCVRLDPECDMFMHYCSKRCLPKPSIKLVTGDG